MTRKPLRPKEIDASLVTQAWKRAVLTGPELVAGAVDRGVYVVFGISGSLAYDGRESGSGVRAC